MADMKMLATIFRNLISNAVKFTGRGGVVTITGEEDGDNIVCAVRDTGIGMRKEQI